MTARDRPAGDVDHEQTARATRRYGGRTRGSQRGCTRRSVVLAPGAAPAVDATAEHLPLDDDSVDAAMVMVTVHQWTDIDRGLRELRAR